VSRIRLSPSASVTPTEVGVILRSDLGMFQLDGPDLRQFVSEMLPLLNGSHEREAVAAALGGYSHPSVLALLDVLEEHGLLETVTEPEDVSEGERWRGQEEYLRKWTDQPVEATKRLRGARVLIVGLEPWGVVAAAELAAAGSGAIHLLDDGEVTPDDLLSVRMWGTHDLGKPRTLALMENLAGTSPWCRITSGTPSLTAERTLQISGAGWDLIVGALTQDDASLLYSLARFAHDAGIMSMSGHLEGLDAVVGPIVVPGQTACWNCWRLRQLANEEHPQAAHALQTSLLSHRPTPRTRTYLAPMPSLLGHLLAMEATKLISRYTPSGLVGRLLVQNLVTLETTIHTAVRMPWCEVCGGAGGGGILPGGPVVGAPDENGGTKSLDVIDNPTDLRRALAGWVDSRAGVIKHLMVGAPDGTAPEFPVTSTAVVAAYTEGTYRPSRPEIASGKGLSSVEAMIGAVGEAIERYSAARYRQDLMHRSPLDALEAEALDPRRLCLYRETQYNNPNFPFRPFDSRQSIEWTKGYWLDNDQPVWLPALLTYLAFWAHPEEQFCQVTSNGLAAGVDLEDAALRALCELVERDAFMLTWLCRLPAKRVLFDAALDVRVHEVVRQLEECGAHVELYLLDVGTAIPTMTCLALGNGKRWPGATVSLAAHPSPRIAVRKAILEQGHIGPHIRRLMLGAESSIPAQPEDVHTLEDHALYYIPAERAQAFDFLRSGGDDPWSLAGLEEPEQISLQDCVRRVQQAGVRVAIADVTSPDVATGPFRVARALGTGMQPIDFGFQLRRLANPRLHAMLAGDLNPQPHPLA